MRFDFREIIVSLKDIFPKLDIKDIKEEFYFDEEAGAHQKIFDITRTLWDGGYKLIFDMYGFYNDKYNSFTGHCHQVTPALGAVLKANGFDDVSYLECYRIRNHFQKTGIVEMVPPAEEIDSGVRDEFCRIKRIPYCCLEVIIDGEPYHLSGKHIKPTENGAKALLSPVCYRDFAGVFAHQDDDTKSGIYLRTVKPLRNPGEIDFSKHIVWMKQTKKDTAPELFATYLRMKLVE